MAEVNNILDDWSANGPEKIRRKIKGKTAESRKRMYEYRSKKSRIQPLVEAFVSNPCDCTFAVLEKEIRWSLRSRIMDIVHDDDATNDIYNTALVNIYFGIGKYDQSKSTFHTWANTVAKNAALNYIEEKGREKKKTIPTVPITSVSENSVSCDMDTIDIVYDDSYEVYDATRIKSEMLDASRECIKYMAPGISDVLTQRYIQNKKMIEIAESLNIPLYTVQNRLKRGGIALGKEVKKRHPALYEMYMSSDVA